MPKVLTGKQYEKVLRNLPKDIKKSEIVYLNKAARETSNEAFKEVKKEFILRNDYTEKSIRYDKATKNNLISVAGSTAKFMGHHEIGKSLGKNLWGQSEDINPLATDYARGGNKRNELAQKYRLNKMGSIGNSKGRKSDKGFFTITTSKGEDVVYERVGTGRKAIKAVRVFKKSVPITKKSFFRKATKTVMNSNKAFKAFKTSMKIELP